MLLGALVGGHADVIRWAQSELHLNPREYFSTLQSIINFSLLFFFLFLFFSSFRIQLSNDFWVHSIYNNFSFCVMFCWSRFCFHSFSFSSFSSFGFMEWVPILSSHLLFTQLFSLGYCSWFVTISINNNQTIHINS